jgi:hypothetical protein
VTAGRSAAGVRDSEHQSRPFHNCVEGVFPLPLVVCYKPTNADLPAILSKRKKNPSYRPLKDRSALDGRVIGWLKTAHRNGPLSGVRTMYI